MFVDIYNSEYGYDSTTNSYSGGSYANSTNKTLTLFARRTSSGVDNYCKQRLYNCKIYSSGTLVMDFQPIKITSTGEYCLLDKVSGKAYHNAGTGEFIGEGYEPPVILDYIQTIGTQYINTSVKATNKTKLEAKLYTANTGNKNWFGGSNGTGSHNFVFNSYSTSSIEYQYGSSDTWNSVSASGVVNSDFIVEYGDGALKINGTKLADLSTSTFTDTNNLCLFVRNGGSAYIDGKMYYCKIYENGTLIRDFIPCKDKNGTVCLWDAVTGVYYYNQGTGQFLDPDFSPTQLTYIQSSGTQYINSGIIPNQDTKIEIDMQSTSSTTSNVFAGARQAYQNNAFYVSQQYGDGGSNPQLYRIAYGTEVYNIPDLYQDTNRRLFVLDGNKAYMDNTLINTFSSQTFTSPVPLWVFTGNNNGSLMQPALMKLYGCKIYDNGILVRDFIPAKDTANVVCLWDNVSKTFFYNAGSGTFTAGEVVNNG